MKARLRFDASILFILTVAVSASRSVTRSAAKYSLLCGKLYSAYHKEAWEQRMFTESRIQTTLRSKVLN